MSQASLEILPAAEYTIVATIQYGDADAPTYRRYVRWTNDIVLDGNTFSAEPSLDFTPGENHGGTEDKPGKLEIRATREPFGFLVSGFRFSPVKITVEQINPSDLSARRILMVGTVAQATKNPAGKAGIVKCVLNGIKSRLADVKLSLAMTTTCQNEFGPDTTHCRVLDYARWVREGTVSAVGNPGNNSITLALTGVSNPAVELINSRYRRGYVIIDGLKLMIKRSYEDGRFDLFSLPNPTLVGKVCTLKPGCDRRHETCNDVWLNEINFMGLGIKIPARNPLFEEG